MNRVNVEALDVPLFFTKKSAREFAENILRNIRVENWSVSIIFCGNDFIKKLNKQFRNKDEATDILSFSMGDIRRGIYYAGDVIISIEELQNNSRYFSVDKNEELKRLIIHGILHLNGMEHATNDIEKEEMLKLQEKLIKNNYG